MKPVSADIDQLAWCRMLSVERLSDSLVASAQRAERIDAQQRVHDARSRAAVQCDTDANDGRGEKRKEKRRPDPAKCIDGSVARREREKRSACYSHEGGGQQRPPLRMRRPQH